MISRRTILKMLGLAPVAAPVAAVAAIEPAHAPSNLLFGGGLAITDDGRWPVEAFLDGEWKRIGFCRSWKFDSTISEVMPKVSIWVEDYSQPLLKREFVPMRFGGAPGRLLMSLHRYPFTTEDHFKTILLEGYLLESKPGETAWTTPASDRVSIGLNRYGYHLMNSVTARGAWV